MANAFYGWSPKARLGAPAFWNLASRSGLATALPLERPCRRRRLLPPQAGESLELALPACKRGSNIALNNNGGKVYGDERAGDARWP